MIKCGRDNGNELPAKSTKSNGTHNESKEIETKRKKKKKERYKTTLFAWQTCDNGISLAYTRQHQWITSKLCECVNNNEKKKNRNKIKALHQIYKNRYINSNLPVSLAGRVLMTEKCLNTHTENNKQTKNKTNDSTTLLQINGQRSQLTKRNFIAYVSMKEIER